MPNNKQYKDTLIDWLGNIPAHWNIIRSKYLWKEIVELTDEDNGDLLSVSQYQGVIHNTLNQRSETTYWI